MSKILPFPGKRNAEDQLREKVLNIMVQLSEDDLYTLQHDVLCRDPSIRRLPSILAEHFREWLNEYGGIDREDMMAPEREGETWAQFAEEFIDLYESEPGYEQQVAIAKSFLNGEILRSLCAAEAQDFSDSPRPGAP